MPNFVLQSYLHDASVASPPQVLFSRFHIFVGSLLQLQHLLLDVKAERDRALGLVAGLGVVAAEGDELLADRAAAIGLALAALCVGDDPLHLPTRGQLAIIVTAPRGVDQGLDGPLDGGRSPAGCIRSDLWL